MDDWETSIHFWAEIARILTGVAALFALYLSTRSFLMQRNSPLQQEAAKELKNLLRQLRQYKSKYDQFVQVAFDTLEAKRRSHDDLETLRKDIQEGFEVLCDLKPRSCVRRIQTSWLLFLRTDDSYLSNDVLCLDSTTSRHLVEVTGKECENLRMSLAVWADKGLE